MSFAGARILAGIVVVGVVAVAVSETANAQTVNSGSVANGGLQSFNYTLDPTQWAQFELDSTAADLTMLVVDDQNSIVCQTSMPNSGNQNCGWMPVAGVVYTVQVQRPASEAAIAAAAAVAIDPLANANAVPGATPVAAPGTDSGLGGATEDFTLSQQSAQ